MSKLTKSQASLSGPPYPPQGALLGGVPNNSVDTPITAVLLFLFMLSAAMHMIVFRVNLRRDHKFIFSAIMFGFSMARISACVMRIVWANRQDNVNIAIASNVLTNAGVILLFIVNILFAKRIVRGYHPRLGKHAMFKHFFSFLVLSVPAVLIMTVVATVITFFTLDASVRSRCIDIQRFSSIWMAILAFVPIPLVVIAMLLPKKRDMEKFGRGKWRTKLVLLLGTTALLALGAAFRAAIGFLPRPASNPAWYHSKACYYCFIFVIEIIVSYSYGLMRIDKRFYIDTKVAEAVGKKNDEEAKESEDYPDGEPLEKKRSFFDRVINNEDALFGSANAQTDDSVQEEPDPRAGRY